MDILEQIFGVPRLFDPEDLLGPTRDIDECSVMAYASACISAFNNPSQWLMPREDLPFLKAKTNRDSSISSLPLSASHPPSKRCDNDTRFLETIAEDIAKLDGRNGLLVNKTDAQEEDCARKNSSSEIEEMKSDINSLLMQLKTPDKAERDIVALYKEMIEKGDEALGPNQWSDDDEERKDLIESVERLLKTEGMNCWGQKDEETKNAQNKESMPWLVGRNGIGDDEENNRGRESWKERRRRVNEKRADDRTSNVTESKRALMPLNETGERSYRHGGENKEGRAKALIRKLKKERRANDSESSKDDEDREEYEDMEMKWRETENEKIESDEEDTEEDRESEGVERRLWRERVHNTNHKPSDIETEQRSSVHKRKWRERVRERVFSEDEHEREHESKQSERSNVSYVSEEEERESEWNERGTWTERMSETVDSNEEEEDQDKESENIERKIWRERLKMKKDELDDEEHEIRRDRGKEWNERVIKNKQRRKNNKETVCQGRREREGIITRTEDEDKEERIKHEGGREEIRKRSERTAPERTEGQQGDTSDTEEKVEVNTAERDEWRERSKNISESNSDEELEKENESFERSKWKERLKECIESDEEEVREGESMEWRKLRERVKMGKQIESDEEEFKEYESKERRMLRERIKEEKENSVGEDEERATEQWREMKRNLMRNKIRNEKEHEERNLWKEAPKSTDSSDVEGEERKERESVEITLWKERAHINTGRNAPKEDVRWNKDRKDISDTTEKRKAKVREVYNCADGTNRILVEEEPQANVLTERMEENISSTTAAPIDEGTLNEKEPKENAIDREVLKKQHQNEEEEEEEEKSKDEESDVLKRERMVDSIKNSWWLNEETSEFYLFVQKVRNAINLCLSLINYLKSDDNKMSLIMGCRIVKDVTKKWSAVAKKMILHQPKDNYLRGDEQKFLSSDDSSRDLSVKVLPAAPEEFQALLQLCRELKTWEALICSVLRFLVSGILRGKFNLIF